MAKPVFLDKDSYIKLVESKACSLQEASAKEVESNVAFISKALVANWHDHLQESLGISSEEYIVLGSYLREEGSLCSDLDLLSLRPEELQDSWQEIKALRIRSIEELNSDEDLDPFYLASLIHYLYFKDDSFIRDSLDKRNIDFLSLISHLKADHKERHERFDNISNYLEPNLKYQPGGLRDIDQALCICYLYGEKDQVTAPFLARLEEMKKRICFVRQVLHTKISSDVLVASYQEYLAEFFGFKNVRAFMSYVSALCEESNFLCRLCFSAEAWDSTQSIDLHSILKRDASRELMGSLVVRYELRAAIQTGSLNVEEFSKTPLFASLQEIMKKSIDTCIEFLFDARILDLLLPDFARVRNLVQHDQYHRYTVGGHTLVCLRRTEDLLAGKLDISKFSVLLKDLSPSDKAILYFTSLFHDLGKGLSGDHSQLGLDIVEKGIGLFTDFEMIHEEVSWMVENHLLFSKAAFRTNLEENAIFKRLNQESLSPRRIRNLFLFTLVDIASSNPEALSAWKMDLLFQLFEKLTRPETRLEEHYQDLLGNGEDALPEDILASLDFDLVDLLEDHEIVKKDFKEAKQNEVASFRVSGLDKNQYLIRFLKNGDETFLFFRLLSFITVLGFNILKVNANTSKDARVYDLILIDDDRDIEVIESLLDQYVNFKADFTYHYPEHARWNLLGENWVVRAEGPKLGDLMLGLSESLSKESLNIEWINIYRWGRQYEVVVALDPKSKPLKKWVKRKWSF